MQFVLQRCKSPCYILTVIIFILSSSYSFAQIEFSDFLFPLEKTSFFAWRGFQEEMPNLYKKANTVISSDGRTTYLYDTASTLQLRIDIEARLNENKSERSIVFRIKFANSNEFKFHIVTQGKDLTLPSIETLRLGQLPFFPKSDNELETRIVFYESRKENFTILIKKDPPHIMKADFYAENRSAPLFTYFEFNTPTYREFSYTTSAEEMFGPNKSLKVTKRQSPQMILGTEEYFVNNQPVSAQEYLEHFSDGPDEKKSLQDFIFGIWQNAFRQLIQNINF